MPVMVLALGLVLLTGEEPATRIELVGRDIEFRVGPRLVAVYRTDPSLPRPHFHPVLAPTGVPLTRAFPMQRDVAGESRDHPHHRGLWVGHQSVKVPDVLAKPVNFWADVPLGGKIVCEKIEPPQGDLVVTRNTWRTFDGKVLLAETRALRLLPRGPRADLLEITLQFHAVAGSVIFGDEKDGFLAVRVADALTETRGQGVLTNAEGKRTMGGAGNPRRTGCWGLRSAWCDYSGPVQGQHVGVALLDDSTNSVAAFWHARDYGLLAANPFGRSLVAKFPGAEGRVDEVTLAAGQTLRFRYGVLLHAGLSPEQISQEQAAWSRSPTPPLR